MPSAQNAASQTLANEWSRGRIAVRNFFNLPIDPNENKWGPDASPLDQATLNFLVMTIPDPIDSGLPHAFDRYLGSLRQALQLEPYFLSRFDLPWQDCFAGSNDQDNRKNDPQKNAKEQKKNDCDNRRYRKEPGFMLLTNPTGAKSKTDLLLVYLVGETPSSGINKRALRAALTEISWFCNWSSDHGDDPIRKIAKGSAACADGRTKIQVVTGNSKEAIPAGIRILGPSYSGSAQSLDLALSYWVDSIRQVKPEAVLSVVLISGTATKIGKGDFSHIRNRLKGGFTFKSMEVPDSVSEQRFCRYLASTGLPTPIKIALLTENGTVYGNAEISESEPGPSACDKAVKKTILPYPLHISQLRAASEKLRQTQDETSQQPKISTTKALPLADSLEDAGLRRDILPFSRADSVTAEQVMASLLDTISRAHYKYVGILATDIRDIIFLAQEVREHSPGSVLFTYKTELLYLHPEINSTLTGMLMVGTYPLFTPNQVWSAPRHPDTLLQFPDENSEGVYNAALVLLGKEEHLEEYGFPFDPDPKPETAKLMPPVWITVVGRDRLWPVNVYSVSADPEANQYTYQLSGLSPGTNNNAEGERSPTKLWWQGIYPPHATILVNVYSTLCVLFCGYVLGLLRRPSAKPRFPNPGGFVPSQGSLTQAPYGRGGLATYRRESLVYLIPACASLAAFVLPLVVSLLIPAIMLREFGAPFTDPSSTDSRQFLLDHFGAVIAILLSSLSLVLLLLSIIVLLYVILLKGTKTASIKSTAVPFAVWGFPVLSSALTFSTALVVSVVWIHMAANQGDKVKIFFACIRFLDLLSGVSPLVPLFLISLAGYLWSVMSYNRRRMFEPAAGVDATQTQPLVAQSPPGFLPLRGLRLLGTNDLEQEIRRRIECSPFELPGWWFVAGSILVGGSYIFAVFIRELEHPKLYWLLGISFLLVSATLWFAVLRFCHVWGEVHCLLKHVASTPLRGACKRFRTTYPTLLKLDLASPVPNLTALSHSIEQAFSLHECASSVVAAQSSIYLAATGTGGGAVSAPVNPGVTGLAAGFSGLMQLRSLSFYQKVQQSEVFLQFAQQAQVNRNGQDVAGFQWASQGPLAATAADVSSVLDGWWSQPRSPLNRSAKSGTPNVYNVCDLAESFLVGRLVHFLAYVLPQLQQLIGASIAGVLLLLLAVTSYPFPPHDVLVWFNWAVVLSLVAIALGVFVQMNRDPILSYLNGTTPGKISWDREFVLRILTYGVIPVLALLGAQFPDSIRQVISYFIPGGATHH
jgi:hypothetical protein